MKKYSFWVFHKEYDQFLESLRDVGVVHVQEKGTPEDEKLSQQLKQLQRFNSAIKGLEKFEQSEAKSSLAALEAVEAYDAKVSAIDAAKSEMQKLDKEIHHVEPWGAFDREEIIALQDENVFLHVFTASALEESWKEDYTLFSIADHGSKHFFVIVTDSAEVPAIEADLIHLPKHSADELKKHYAELQEQRNVAEKELEALTAAVPAIEAEVSVITDDVQLTKVQLYTESIADDKAMLIEGYAPVEKEAELEGMLKAKGVFFTAEAANAEDDVPILLKNNKFNQLFEVIADLYAKPKYNEFDLTPFFGIFYMLFFGFCLGDAGYGLFFMAIATVMKGKVGESAKSVVTLVQLLSLSTIVFGLVGGTFFGIELYKAEINGVGLPVYRDIAALFADKQGTFVGDYLYDVMLKASLGFGITQMLLGMFINGFKLTRQKGFIHGVSAFSWALLFVFSIANAAITGAQGLEFMNPVYMVLAGITLFGIFFMNSPGKNPFVNFGAGLWDTYNTVIGGVGDLLSYMRLFALALASSILGLVFNQLSTGVLNTDGGVVSLIFSVIGMLLIMVVGHAINIFMSTLSSAVHPLRLTFVEFYKNAGFEGGGKPFSPFRKTA